MESSSLLGVKKNISLDSTIVKIDVENNVTEESINQNLDSKLYKTMLLIISSVGVLFLVIQVIATNTSNTLSLPHGTMIVEDYHGIDFRRQSSHSSYKLSIQASSRDYGVLESTDMLPWDAIIEPAREQILQLTEFHLSEESVNMDTIDDNYDIKWTIHDQTYSGSSITVTIPSVGIYKSLIEIAPKGNNNNNNNNEKRKFTKDFKLAVKYVRREIRSMTDKDRNSFLDALNILYTLSSEDGVVKYGDKYKPMEYFLYKHLKGGARSDCDSWHDGAGILTHHLAITLELEQSLQAIDPSISVPYWEFSMDSYLYDHWSQSPIFKSDWFGEANPSSRNHEISSNSRWSSVKFPSGDKYKDWSIQKTGSLNPFVNAYGIMRSPWNANARPFLTRRNQTYNKAQYKSLPDCNALRSCFQSTSLASIHDCTNGATHGPVHILIGGAWGDEEVFSSGRIDFLRRPQKLLFFKILWRMGFTRCPTSCNTDSVNDENTCRCSVPDEYIQQYGAYSILKESRVIYPIEQYLEDADDDMYLEVLRAIESPGMIGDMFSSASSYDPTFWPLHGATERFVGLKRIMVKQGDITDFDENWGYPEYDRYNGAAYLRGRCDWSNVKDSTDLTLPQCDKYASCNGHDEDDVIEFTNFKGKGETYTNKEFYDFLHPWNDDLPYLYDTYRYDFCSDQGIDFNDYTNSNSNNEDMMGLGEGPPPLQ